MKYVVIEDWENIGYPMLVTNEEGITKVFESEEDAKDEAEECHNGIVVAL